MLYIKYKFLLFTRGQAHNDDSLEVITCSLHFTLNVCLEKAISPNLFRTFLQFLRVRRTKPNFTFFRNGRLSSSTGSAGRHPFAQPRLTFSSQLHRFRSDLAANESNNKNRSTSGESPELSMILDKAQVIMTKQIIKLIDSAVEVGLEGTWLGHLARALR